MDNESQNWLRFARCILSVGTEMFQTCMDFHPWTHDLSEYPVIWPMKDKDHCHSHDLKVLWTSLDQQSSAVDVRKQRIIQPLLFKWKCNIEGTLLEKRQQPTALERWRTDLQDTLNTIAIQQVIMSKLTNEIQTLVMEHSLLMPSVRNWTKDFIHLCHSNVLDLLRCIYHHNERTSSLLSSFLQHLDVVIRESTEGIENTLTGCQHDHEDYSCELKKYLQAIIISIESKNDKRIDSEATYIPNRLNPKILQSLLIDLTNDFLVVYNTCNIKVNDICISWYMNLKKKAAQWNHRFYEVGESREDIMGLARKWSEELLDFSSVYELQTINCSDSKRTDLHILESRHTLTETQWSLMLLSRGNVDLQVFHMTLSCTLPTNICLAFKPPESRCSGEIWNKDHSVGADLVRLKNCRKNNVAHVPNPALSNLCFKTIWAILEIILYRLYFTIQNEFWHAVEQKIIELRRCSFECRAEMKHPLEPINWYKSGQTEENLESYVGHLEALNEKVKDLILCILPDIPHLKTPTGYMGEVHAIGLTPEVLQMDMHSQELYQYTINSRNENVCIIKVMVVEHHDIEKTTLIKQLLEKEITIAFNVAVQGITLQYGYFKKDNERSKWNVGNMGLTPEILQKDLYPQELYQYPLNAWNEKVWNMIVRQHDAGKTTLIKQLLEKEIVVTLHISMPVITVHSAYCKIDDERWIWNLEKLDSCISFEDDKRARTLEISQELRIKYYDDVFLCSGGNKVVMYRFCDHLKNDQKMKLSGSVKGVLYEELFLQAGYKLKQLESALKRCTYILLYLRIELCEDNCTKLSKEEYLYLMEKQCCVVPVSTVLPKSPNVKIPSGLKSIKGIYYYYNDQNYRDVVTSMIENKLDERHDKKKKQKDKQITWLQSFKKVLPTGIVNMNKEELRTKQQMEQKTTKMAVNEGYNLPQLMLIWKTEKKNQLQSLAKVPNEKQSAKDRVTKKKQLMIPSERGSNPVGIISATDEKYVLTSQWEKIFNSHNWAHVAVEDMGTELLYHHSLLQILGQNILSTASHQKKFPSAVGQRTVTRSELGEYNPSESNKIHSIKGIIKLLQEYADESKQDPDRNSHLLLWDIAGHDMFYTIHQMFPTSQDINYIISDFIGQPTDVVDNACCLDSEGIKKCRVRDFAMLTAKSTVHDSHFDGDSLQIATTKQLNGIDSETMTTTSEMFTLTTTPTPTDIVTKERPKSSIILGFVLNVSKLSTKWLLGGESVPVSSTTGSAINSENDQISHSMRSYYSEEEDAHFQKYVRTWKRLPSVREKDLMLSVTDNQRFISVHTPTKRDLLHRVSSWCENNTTSPDVRDLNVSERDTVDLLLTCKHTNLEDAIKIVKCEDSVRTSVKTFFKTKSITLDQGEDKTEQRMQYVVDDLAPKGKSSAEIDERNVRDIDLKKTKKYVLHRTIYPVLQLPLPSLSRDAIVGFIEGQSHAELGEILKQLASNEIPEPHITMRYDMLRLCTMKTFPGQDRPFATRITGAGFYYAGHQDQVICYCCGSRKDNWVLGDVPMLIHQKMSPNCCFLTDNVAVNVPVSKTNSTTSASADLRLLAIQGSDGSNQSDTAQGEPSLMLPSSEQSQVKVSSGTHQMLVTSISMSPNQMMSSRGQNVLDSPQTPFAHANALEDPPPKYPQYAVKTMRTNSFQGWSAELRQKPEEMADCGFYYAGFSDCVRCFHCGVGLRHWMSEDDPWIEHARWSISCVYVRKMKGEEFVNLVKMAVEIAEREEESRNNGGANQPTQSNTETAPTTTVKEDLHGNKSAISVTARDSDCSMVNRGSAVGGAAASAPSHGNAEIQKYLLTDAAQSVLEMGYQPKMVLQAIENVLMKKGTEELTGQIIMETLFEIEEQNKPKGQPKPSPLSAQENESSPEEGEAAAGGTSEGLQIDPEKIRREHRELREVTLCKICLDNTSSVVFLPCGHLVTCPDCAPAMRKCPICRTLIKGTVKTFFG